MVIWETLWQLVENLGTLAVELLRLAVRHGLFLAWTAWWLWGVNWPRAWTYLRNGGWAPLVLLSLVAALVWSRLDPSGCTFLGVVEVPAFWCQLGGVSLIVAYTLFLGWLQGLLRWTPPEVSFEPAADAAHGATAHGHEDVTADQPGHGGKHEPHHGHP